MKKIKRTISLLKHPFRRKYKEKLIISQNLNKSGITLPSFYKSFNVPITAFRNMKKTRRKLLKVHNHIFIEHSYGMAVAVNVKIRAKNLLNGYYPIKEINYLFLKNIFILEKNNILKLSCF